MPTSPLLTPSSPVAQTEVAASQLPTRPFLNEKVPFRPISRFSARWIVEGVGTFIFLATISLAEVSCGISAIDGRSHTRNLAPLAEGFILCVLIFTFGYISGGHFNPAVTFAVVMTHGMQLDEATSYWIAQVVGAFLGSGLGIIVSGTTRHLPAPQVYRNLATYVFVSFITEAVMTALLVTIVLHVGYSQRRGHQYAGLAVGLFYLAAEYAVGGVSGGTFNPAAATALQLTKLIAAGYVSPLLHLWVYWAAPAVGAVGAAMIFKVTHPAPKEDEEGNVISGRRRRQMAKDLYDN